MSDVQTLYVSGRKTGPKTFPEFSLVAPTVPVRGDDGTEVPAGTRGTIVGVLGGGEAYLVEFGSPLDDVATVPAKDLAPER